MRRVISFFVFLALLLSFFPMYPSVLHASQPVLTVNKSTFAVGEDIVVSFSNLDPSAYTSTVEIRIYKEGDIPGTHASTDYAVIRSTTVNLGSSGTLTFPEDGARTNVTSYAAGNYKVMMFNGSTSICEPVTFTITGNLAISTDKLKYELGEKITVSYTNVAASLAGNQDIEVRLYKDGDIPGTHASVDYYIVYKQSANINNTYSRSITFPDDGARNLTKIDPGKYKVFLLRANTQLCDPVTITVGEPVLTLNKTVYTEGETITVNYRNAYAGHDKGLGVEIRIYKLNDIPGTHASQDYYILQNKTSGIARPETGTLIFPANGARNKTKYDVGEYKIMVVYANTPISEILYFRVVKPVEFSYSGAQIRTSLVPYKDKNGIMDEGDLRQGLRFCFEDIKEKGSTVAFDGSNYTVVNQSAMVILKDNLTGKGELTIDNAAIQDKVITLPELLDYTVGTKTYKSVYIYNIPETAVDTVICARVFYECVDSLGNTHYFYSEIMEDSLRTVYNRIDESGKAAMDSAARAWFE